MAGNSFGQLFRITTFGESHGPALGVVIDGCPPLLEIDESFIQSELDRRKPGQSSITTTRKEDETFEILSGVFEGKSTGAPIAIIVRNKDQRSADYHALKEVYRPSHADYTWQQKYGIRDYRGSGRASARETISRVMAGAVAKMILQKEGINIQAYVSQVGTIAVDKHFSELDLSKVETNLVRCPDEETAHKMIHLIEEVKSAGDTVGGKITCVINGVPVGLGEPVFDKLHAELGKAILSINACKGFEIGSGFKGATKRGSEQNDLFTVNDTNKVITRSNNSGGIQGGISNGEPIYFNCAFKPVSTLHQEQETINTSLEKETIMIEGRHDPCVLPRAVVIVESMAALVLADFLMRR